MIYQNRVTFNYRLYARDFLPTTIKYDYDFKLNLAFHAMFFKIKYVKIEI